MPRGKRARGQGRTGRLIALVSVGALAIALTLRLTHVPGGARAGGAPARVLIPAGASFRAAADSLAAAGLIRWPRLFSLYGSFKGRDRTIRAGTYQLARGQPWDALIDALHTGRGVVASITIPEGWQIRRIVPYLAKELEIAPESLEAAVRDSALRARLGVPTPTLEGYLFPDTYVVALGTTARQVVALLVSRFERVWKPEWTARLDTLQRTRHEVVTLASIVEKEVRHAEEHPVVAAVYWNRLRINMPLQADPTILYALGRSVARVLYRDLEVKSPYNTYRNPGLPPGPIASPGASALEHTLYPAQVPYRYFVASPDGYHEFRRTFSEHQDAIRTVRARARADSIRRAAAGDSAARDSTTARPTARARDSSRAPTPGAPLSPVPSPAGA